ncbi:MAG: hypothetical protein WBF66_12615, partial [Dehalococcoidia bacterium]
VVEWPRNDPCVRCPVAAPPHMKACLLIETPLPLPLANAIVWFGVAMQWPASLPTLAPATRMGTP